MPVLDIKLFGTCSIVADNRPVTALSSLRLQALLAFLLLQRRAPQPRQLIAFQIWPDSAEEQALGNLRKALHSLRHALPDFERFVQVDTQHLQWRPDAPCTLDVNEFERCIEQTGATRQSDMLEQAAALYRGDLLRGCYDEWIVPERERLRQLFIEALEKLTWLAEERRDYATAIHYANQLLSHDPLHEATYRRLMRIHALDGDRARALQVYHTCASVLQRELGVPPSPEIEHAYERLMRLEIPAVLRELTATAANQIRLVGRRHEWEALRAHWQAASHGGVQFCLISGEAGIGKTRLAEELTTWALRQGVVTAAARSYAAEGQVAFSPLIDCLRSEAMQKCLQELDKTWLSEIARLLPELLVQRPDVPRPQAAGSRRSAMVRR